MGKKRNTHRILVRMSEGKMPLGRPRRRWVDIIKTDLGEMERGDTDCVDLAHDRGHWRYFVNTVMNSAVPTGSFSRSTQFHEVS
jgi:hypothetical protein